MNMCDHAIILLKQKIAEIEPQQAHAMQQQGGMIVDVRSLEEYQKNHIKEAIYLGRDYLEFKIEQHIPKKETTIITHCASGFRSLFAAQSLLQLGYENVYSMSGGFKHWHQLELPTEI